MARLDGKTSNGKKTYMRNGMKGILPKGPGVGPNGTLPRGYRSRDGSRTLPLEISPSAGVGDSGSMRHSDERGKVKN